MKKALMIASMASMLQNFNTYNIEILHGLGYEITLAGNFKTEDSISSEQVKNFKDAMKKKGYYIRHIDFTRLPLNIKGQIKSYRQVKKLSEENYVLVHCHAPISAAITRFVFRKKRKEGLKVVYTAHGFHFYKGAPLKNWMLYFPVEWICAHWTDMLITINQEDFRLARKYLRAKEIKYIPGVGIDFEKFQMGTVNREEKRKSLGLKQEDKMLLSVGELITRKNHAIVIKALQRIHNPNIKYFICGIGVLEAELHAMIKESGLENQVYLLGYRRDVSELCQAADLFIFPSLQEGLPVALMEAIAVKTPAICSGVRGNTELIKEKRFLFDPYSEEAVIRCIGNAMETDMTEVVERHYELLRKYDLNLVSRKMKDFYYMMRE